MGDGNQGKAQKPGKFEGIKDIFNTKIDYYGNKKGYAKDKEDIGAFFKGH